MTATAPQSPTTTDIIVARPAALGSMDWIVPGVDDGDMQASGEVDTAGDGEDLAVNGRVSDPDDHEEADDQGIDTGDPIH